MESFLAQGVTGQASRTSCSEAGGREGRKVGKGGKGGESRRENGWGAMGTGRVEERKLKGRLGMKRERRKLT